MSAYVIVEFAVKDPDVHLEKCAANAGQTAAKYGLPMSTEGARESV